MNARLQSSLARHIPSPPTDSDHVRAMAAAAFFEGRGVWFSTDDLKRLPWQARELIEAEARKIYGEQRRVR